MITTIFIRTCKKDIEWIPYCLKSIEKYGKGFDETVLICPDHEKEAFQHFKGVRLSYVEHYENDHLGQQLDKIEAWRRVANGLVVFMDSDCLFTHPVTPESFFLDGKVFVPKTPYNDPLVSDARCWQKPTQGFLGWPVRFEYMHRFPLVYWSSTLKNFHDWFVRTRKTPLRDAVLSVPVLPHYRFGAFSEFNVIGAWAEVHEGERYRFIDRTKDPVPERVVRQFWTWGGVEPVKQEIEEILK